MRHFVLIILCLVCLGATPAAAQTLAGQLSGPQTLGLFPATPGPNELVTASIDLSTIPAGSTIEWFFNGTNQPTMKNQSRFKFTTGDISTYSTVAAQIIKDGVVVRELSSTVRPVRVDIIFEPRTYVPRWYKGAPLPSRESKSRVRALVFADNGVNLNSLSYRWRVDEYAVGRTSSMNNSVIEVETPTRQASRISVEVIDTSGNTIASRSITFPTTKPTVLFYTTNPLLGISPLAIGKTLILSGAEETVRAVPFFISLDTLNSNPLTEWRSGGQLVAANTDSDGTYEVAVSAPFGGRSLINFRVQDFVRFSQGASGSFEVTQ